MSSIIENLKKILESRYGKDVRQAIHDSISDINDIATEAQEKAITAQDSAEASATAAQASATASADSATAAAESAAEAKGYAPEGYDELKAEVASIDTDLGDKTSASAVTGDDAFSKIDTLNTSISTVDGKVDASSIPSTLGTTCGTAISALNDGVAVSSIPSTLGTTCGGAISALNDEVGASSIPSALGTSCGAAISAINTDLAMDSIPSALGTTVGGAISSLNSNLANMLPIRTDLNPTTMAELLPWKKWQALVINNSSLMPTTGSYIVYSYDGHGFAVLVNNNSCALYKGYQTGSWTKIL